MKKAAEDSDTEDLVTVMWASEIIPVHNPVFRAGEREGH